MPETPLLVYHQNKHKRTNFFSLEGIDTGDKEARRSQVFEKLSSKRGQYVKTVQILPDTSRKEALVVCKFEKETDSANLLILEPETEEPIGYICALTILQFAATDIIKGYGIQGDPGFEDGAHKIKMRNMYQNNGIMKAAFACFQLGIEEHGLLESICIVDPTNIASIQSSYLPPLENLSFTTTETDFTSARDGITRKQLTIKTARS